MITATIFEAKTNLSDLVKKAQKGEIVIITSGRDKNPSSQAGSDPCSWEEAARRPGEF